MNNAKMVLLGIAILCELGGMAGWPGGESRWNLIAAGLLFFFISLLIPNS